MGDVGPLRLILNFYIYGDKSLGLGDHIENTSESIYVRSNEMKTRQALMK